MQQAICVAGWLASHMACAFQCSCGYLVSGPQQFHDNGIEVKAAV
jgi:hypothetical protein